MQIYPSLRQFLTDDETKEGLMWWIYTNRNKAEEEALHHKANTRDKQKLPHQITPDQITTKYKWKLT